MKRLVLAAILLALTLAPDRMLPSMNVDFGGDTGLRLIGMLPTGEVLAQTADCSLAQNFVGVPAYFETITVSTTAIGLTAATYKPTGGQPASMMAFMTTETDLLRFRMDGVAPTAAIGHQVASGSVILICQASLPKFQAIRSGAVDVPLRVTYFTAPQ